MREVPLWFWTDPNVPLQIYDAGVDANEYRPISLDEIAHRMNLSPIKGK